MFNSFLLLARYVPNVAKRSIIRSVQYWAPIDRPTTDLCSWKSFPGRTSNSYISITVQGRRMVDTRESNGHVTDDLICG